MSSSHRPVVAYTIRVYEDEEPRHSVYSDAYGLEMTIDDEWEIDTILMTVPELVEVITGDTDVTSEAAVFVGASSAPSDGNFQSIVDAEATHVLLGPNDDIAAALSAGLCVILNVSPETSLVSVLDGLSVTSDKVIVAVQPPAGPTPDEFQSLVGPFRAACQSCGCPDARILIAAVIDQNDILNYLALDDVDGVLLHGSSYGVVVDILSVIADA